MRLRLMPLFLLTSLFLSGCNDPQPSGKPNNQTALTHILVKRELRCGYLVYSPYIRRDPNTGKMSGIFYDLMEDIGHNAGIKIVWAEEVGYENIFSGLDAGRYDAFCGGLWPNATRATAGYFSEPVFYSVITAWGRNNDQSFGQDPAELNRTDIKISTIDGAMEDLIAKTTFPQATRLSMPQLTPFTQNMMNIIDGKAKVTFAEPSMMEEFLAKNPGTMKELYNGKPLRVFGNALVIKRGDDELLQFLNAALRETLYSGQVEEILRAYEPAPNAFRRIASPYQPSQPEL